MKKQEIKTFKLELEHPEYNTIVGALKIAKMHYHKDTIAHKQVKELLKEMGELND